VAEGSAPLILTLAFEPDAFAFLDGLRRRHFPPERNVIPAHLTLFHHLPGAHEPVIVGELEALCARQPPITLTVSGLCFLGRGVAYALEAPALQALRRALAAKWHAWLTPQDRQGFRPRVTVQNKVSPEEARSLHRDLSARFAPFRAHGQGLQLWRYRGGPWQLARSFRFEDG
jgi:2'-5' RNA ligase superfamily protein